MIIGLTADHPTDYRPDTPERAVAEFMLGWRERDWSKVAEAVQLSVKAEFPQNQTWKRSDGSEFDVVVTLETYLKATLGGRVLFEWRLGESLPVEGLKESMATDTKVWAFWKGRDGLVEGGCITARAMREMAPYKPSASGLWGVNPASAARFERDDAAANERLTFQIDTRPWWKRLRRKQGRVQ